MKYLVTGVTACLFFLTAVMSLSAQNISSVQGDLEALTDLYSATNGDNWSNNSGWLNGNPSNDWHGVEVDGNGRVIKLDLYKNKLSGELPESIGNLSRLRFFSIKRNPIYSVIPSSIQNWTEAETIMFSAGNDRYNEPTRTNPHSGKTPRAAIAKYYGTIPDVFDRMPNLEVFEVAWSQDFDPQPFPSTLYQHKNLRFLNLTGNKLEGELKDIFNLPNLEVFLISSNNWSGSLPSTLGNSTKMKKFFVQHSDGFKNNLTSLLSGEIPSSFANFREMKHFFIGNNNFTGEIPGFIFENWSTDPRDGLRDFRIEGNNFSGTVPSELGEFNLLTFSIADNNFTGPLPARIVSGMQNVIIFSVRKNNLSGNLPNGQMVDGEWKGWRTKTRLRTWVLGANNFTGPLPDMPEYVGDMSLVIFSGNQFEGSIPDTWRELFTPSLRDDNPRRVFNLLRLNGNSLQGIIPEWFTSSNGPTNYLGGNKWAHKDILENSVDVKLDSNPAKPLGHAITKKFAIGDAFEFDYSHKVHSADRIKWSKYNDSLGEWNEDERFNGKAVLEIANIQESDYGSYRMELYNKNTPLPDWVYSELIVIEEGEESNDSSGTTDDAQNSFPNAPVLLRPDHQAISMELRPKFEWSTVGGADYYIIHVSRLSPAGGMTLDVIKDETTEPTFTPKVSLEPHTLYYWQVKPIKDDEDGEWSEQWEFSLLETIAQKSVSFQSNEQQPVVTSLDQNYPNPFNPTTRIEFALSEAQKVSLHVYDMSGRQVAMLVDDVLQAGHHSAIFDASQLSSGIYIYRFISDSQQFSRKMTLIK